MLRVRCWVGIQLVVACLFELDQDFGVLWGWVGLWAGYWYVVGLGLIGLW